MSYRSIVASVNQEERAAEVINAAALLAEASNAHLTGVYFRPIPELYVAADMPVPLELTELQEREFQELSTRLGETFDRLTSNGDFVAEWCVFERVPITVADSIAERANVADLLVVSQVDPEHAGSVRRELPERLMTMCSRPVIVVPKGLEASSIGREIFVAWDGGRESTRAVFDALPLLKRAAHVRLHRINLPHEDRHAIMGITEELASTLSRHDVNVEVFQSDARDYEVASELLKYAAEMQADLLVSGCFGHSRLREFLLGGTSRELLRRAKIPLLMAH